jgi:hypothetical protein
MVSQAAIPAVPPMATAPHMELTYGLELEFVFAFQQSKLETVLKTGDMGRRDGIEKNIPFYRRSSRPYTAFRDANQLPDHWYNSWGLTKYTSRSSVPIPAPYGTESMEIVSSVLSKKVPSYLHTIKPTMAMKDKTQDKYNYGAIITVDHSVCGVGSRNIPKWLTHVDDADAENWDSYGVEFVSPVFTRRIQPFARETGALSEAVKTIQGTATDRYGAFVTNQ